MYNFARKYSLIDITLKKNEIRKKKLCTAYMQFPRTATPSVDLLASISGQGDH